MRGHANVRSIVSCCLKHGKVLSDDDGVDGVDESDASDGREIEIAFHQRLVIPDDLAYFLLDGFYLLVKQRNHLIQALCLFLAHDLFAIQVAYPVLDIEFAFLMQFAQFLHRLVRYSAWPDGLLETEEVVGNLGSIQTVVLLTWLDGIVLDDGRLQHRVLVALLVEEVLQTVRIEARVLHAIHACGSIHIVFPEPPEQFLVACLAIVHLGMNIPHQIAVLNENGHVEPFFRHINANIPIFFHNFAARLSEVIAEDDWF